MELIEGIIKRAQANPQRIILPEGTEERTLKAADIVLEQKIADITLLGNQAEIEKLAAEYGLKNITKATIIDPNNNPNSKTYSDLLFKLRQKKGMTEEQAEEKVKDPLYLACLMIKNGDVAGEVAGAKNFTGDVLRPAFQIVKTRPGIGVVSGCFIMIFKDKSIGHNGLMLFADCAATPNPDAEQLMNACKGFEAYFVQKVIEQVKTSILDNEEEDSEYMKYFGDMMNEQYANIITENGGVGLAQQLYDSMKDHYNL